MIFLRLESRKNLAFVYDFTLLFRVFALCALNIFKVQEPSIDYKPLPSNALVKPRCVQLKHIFLELDIFWGVIIVKLHICEQQLGIHIIFLVKIATLGLVAQYILARCLGRGISISLLI
jgi:hypothetical protein